MNHVMPKTALNRRKYLWLAAILLSCMATPFAHASPRTTCSDIFLVEPQHIDLRPIAKLANMDAIENLSEQIMAKSTVFKIRRDDDLRFLAALPRMQSTGDLNRTLPVDLQTYLDQVSGGQLKLDPTPVLSRDDARIFFARDEMGAKRMVIKIFPDRDSSTSLIHEVASSARLGNLHGTAFSFVKIQDVMRLSINGSTRTAMLVDMAPGMGFSEFLKTNPEGADINAYMSMAATGYAQFHRSNVRDVGNRQARSDRSYDIARLRQYLDQINFKKMAQDFGLNTDIGKIKPALDALVARVENADMPFQTYAHGDGHIDNVFVAEDKVTFIDYLSAEWSFDRSNDPVRPRGDPLSDIGRFLEGARVEALKAGRPLTQINQFENIFLDTYARQWGMARSRIDDLTTFYRLRFALVRLFDFGGLAKPEEKKLILEDLVRRFTETAK